MPYKHEHACRLNDPGKYDSFARKNCEIKHEEKCIDVIYGIKAGKSEVQAYRYSTDIWSEKDAEAHCEDHDGKFEAAQKEKKELIDDTELRTFDIAELRVEEREDKKPVIKGYAIVFNKLSEDLGGFREQVAPTACSKTIASDDIRAAFNHDANYILGRNKAGTLLLEEDNKGISFEIDPPDTQWCRDLQVSIGRGDINQCSFKFNTIKDTWENKKDGSMLRTLDEIKLFDISIVTYPAYPQTSAKVRNYLDALSESLDNQDAPKEGCVDSLEIPKRRQAFLELNK